jgi:hypothetical protein
MNSDEKTIGAQPLPGRMPASLEEAYELGWRYQYEIFLGRGGYWQSKEKIARRVGYARFVSEQGVEIEIPFVARFEFGTPRPEQPNVITPEEEAERERVSLWKAEALYNGQALATLEVRGTRDDALDRICNATSLELDATEITDQSSAGESTPPQDQK